MHYLNNLDKIQDPLQMMKAFAIHAPVGIQIYDVTGHWTFVNDKFISIFGAPPPLDYCVLKDELVASAGTLHLIHRAFGGEPAQLPLMWYDARNLKQVDVDIANKCAIETYMVPVFDRHGCVTNVVFIFKDVTGEQFMLQERQRAFKERDDAKVLVQRVFDQTQAVIYIKDLDGKFVFANGQFCRIFGKTSEQILGKRDHDLFPKELADAFRENDFHVLKTRSHSEIEEVAVHADGTTHTYLSLKFPLDDSTGSFYGVCGISTDITQYRLLERELSAAKRMEALGLLAGGIAHDFHNNLGIILLLADTLIMTGATGGSKWRTSLESIKSAAQTSALLTRQLLAFGRQQTYQPRPLNLGAVVLDMKNILANALGEDIDFSTDVVSELWPVYVDPMQIEQVLTNLCFNSRDAMPQGGSLKVVVRNAVLKADQGRWRIGRPSGAFVELMISDNGVGMKDDMLDRIFEPFFTTKKEGLGTGLGLSTVYGIVQGAKGDIIVESNTGKGTIFRVFFPKSEGSMAEEFGLKKGVETPGGTETILLVEDKAALRNVTASLLRECGYRVIEATGGKAALDLWKTFSEQVDLVMTDIIMPEVSGLELIQEMSRVGAKRGIRKLFVSAYSKEKLSDYSFSQEALYVLQKPYTANALLTKLREVFESSI